jgi:hypothetical protein
MLRIAIILTLTFSYLRLLDAQFYNAGQAPPRVRWMQVKTENFQVIYPSGLYSEAGRCANILEYMYEFSSANLEHKPRKVSILLYNESTVSNGFVVWAPRRSEWITTPPSDSYAQDWLEQLALHEFRHVVQVDKLNQGFTHLLSLVFGEMAVGAMTGFIPLWFLEGDATANETAHSSTGRGRQPGFSKELRAIELEMGERYSYDQSCFGSYKYFIPNHYKYGYQMVSYARLKYNSKLWSQVLENVARRPFVFAPFYFGLRKNGAVSKVHLYHATFDSLNTFWTSSVDTINVTKTLSIGLSEAKYYTNYIFPQATQHGTVVAREGIDDIYRFILIRDTTEEILYTPGRYYGTSFSAGDRYIVWEENVPDVRWGRVSYSILKRFDYKTRKVKTLTWKTRYFSPALSADESKIACIEIDGQNRFYVLIVNTESGEAEKRMPLGKGEYAYSPRWIDDESLVLFTMDREGKKLEHLSLADGKREVLFNSGYYNIANPAMGNEMIFFSRDIEMARNIYAYSFTTKNCCRVIQSVYHADYPDFSTEDSMLLWSDYTLEGFRPVRIRLNDLETVPAEQAEKYNYAWAGNLSKSEKINLQESSLPERNFDSLSYNRLLHAFTIHSWAPFYFDRNDPATYSESIKPGAMLLLQNKLSTITSSLNYYYENGAHTIMPEIAWRGLFPVFEASALFRDTPGALRTDPGIEQPPKPENYYQLKLRSYLPLNFTRNKYSRILQPSLAYIYDHAYYIVNNRYRIGRDYLEMSMSGSRLLKSSHRDLYPRFGQSIFLLHKLPLLDREAFGTKTLANLNFYFPGIVRHHSTRINYGHEKNEYADYPHQYAISLPRGYSREEGTYYSEIIRGSLEYYFPFLYPDWSIGPAAYIKRLHASVFYDQAFISYYRGFESDNAGTATYRSVGISIAAEMHLLRFIFPLSPKATFSYLPTERKYFLGINLSISTSMF